MSPILLDSSKPLRVIRVFLASPGDLVPERTAAHAAVNEINRTVARPAGFQIDLIGWEDTLSSFGRPQAVINEELDTCDAFIGLIWQRWGTPPGKDNKYTSGFEEEYERSKQRYQATKTPTMRLFFKDVDPSKAADAGPELRKVLDFKAKVIEEKALLFQTFKDAGEFAQHVRIGLADLINRLKTVEPRDEDGGGEKSTDTGGTKSVATNASSVGQAKEAGLLNDISNALTSSSDTNISAAQVARLRNLSNALSVGGNDQAELGSHDANILYVEKGKIDFSSRELSALADAGLDGLTHENAPLWSWLSGRLKKLPSWLTLSTFIGPDRRRINAFKVLALMGGAVELAGSEISKEQLLQIWMDQDSEKVKIAALEFLADFGSKSDLDIILKNEKQFPNTAKNIFEKTRISILLREDDISAANILIDSHQLLVDEEFLTVAVSVLQHLPNERLVAALTASSAIVRARALSCLEERDALSDSILLRLLNDSALQIRVSVLTKLECRGHTFTEDEAKSHLVRENVQNAFAIGGIGGTVGKEEFEDFKARQLENRSLDELNSAGKSAPFTADTMYFAACRKQPKKRLREIREHFDDGFSRYFDEHSTLIREVYGAAKDVVEDVITQGEKMWRRKWMRAALDLIEQHGSKDDLERVRNALDLDRVDPKKRDIEFFERFGSFDDIGRICRIDADYRSGVTSSTLLAHQNDPRKTARTILQLAKGNLINLLSVDIPDNVLSTVILIAKNTEFKKLTGSQLENLLNHSRDPIRKAAALKTISAWSFTEANNRLEKYVTSEKYRYYNIIFWMDLVAAFPSSVARKIADRAAKKMS